MIAVKITGRAAIYRRHQRERGMQTQPSDPRRIRLSAPALETLAVVAYRQPVLRAEVEAVRGVGCGEVLRQLIERDLVRISGRSEELGRPYLYSTTTRFLQIFGLGSLEDLPRREILQAPFAPPLADCPLDGQESESHSSTHPGCREKEEESAVTIVELSEPEREEKETNRSAISQREWKAAPANDASEEEEYEDDDLEEYDDEDEDDEDDEYDDDDMDDEDWEEVEDDDEFEGDDDEYDDEEWDEEEDDDDWEEGEDEDGDADETDDEDDEDDDWE